MKRSSSQIADVKRSTILIKHLGKYSLTALTPEIIAKFRDIRLAGEDRRHSAGAPRPRANNTVRLDVALLGHLFTLAIKEGGVGLPSTPVMNIRRPAPGAGRNRRMSKEEESTILTAVDSHSNPMLGWIVRIALQTGMRLSEIVTLQKGPGRLEPTNCAAAQDQEHASSHGTTDNSCNGAVSSSARSPCEAEGNRIALLRRAGQDGGAGSLSVRSNLARAKEEARSPRFPLSRSAPRSRQSLRRGRILRPRSFRHQRSQIHADAQALYAFTSRGPCRANGCSSQFTSGGRR